MANFFYHDMIRKLTVGFMKHFTDIHVRRHRPDGSIIKDIKVPITFDAKHKMVLWVLGQFGQHNIGNVLPAMSVEFTGLTPSPDRQGQKYTKLIKRNETEKGYKYQFHPAPYDLTFKLSVWSKLMVDVTQIVEQIGASFSPSLSFELLEIPLLGIKRDVEIILDDISPDVVNELASEMDERIIVYDFAFTVRGYLYPPIKEQSVVETLLWMLHDGTRDDTPVPMDLVSITENVDLTIDINITNPETTYAKTDGPSEIEIIPSDNIEV